jgi:hypothetical protein
MFVDENNRKFGNLGQIPSAGISMPFLGSNEMQLTDYESRKAWSQRAECGNELMASNNKPPRFAISGAAKVAFYESRIPYLLRCLRGDRSLQCQQTRANQGNCLAYTIWRMIEAYSAAKILRDSERSAKQTTVASMNALSRLRRGASQTSPLIQNFGVPSIPKRFKPRVFSPTGPALNIRNLTPFQNEFNRPGSSSPSDSTSANDLLNFAQGLQPGQNRQDFGLMSQPERGGYSEDPGMTMGIDCYGISTDPEIVASLISQCRISLEGENANYTSSLPPQEQPCNVLMACGGGRIPPSDDVTNAIISCAEDQGYDSLACDRLEILLNEEYPAVGASMPIDPNMSLPGDEPNMSLPDDEGDYYPDGPMSLPPEDGGTITVPGPGVAPGVNFPVKEEENDKTMLYVGIGAAVLIAAYFVTQKRK